MKRVIIIGARADGQGKVVLEILQAMRDFKVVGFIDDDPSKRGLVIRGLPVIGAVAELDKLKCKYDLQGGLVAIADNPARRYLGERIRDANLELVNAIHPTAHLDSDVSLGKGNVICQGVIIITGTGIGNSVNIHTGTTIDHDNVLEDGVNIGPGVHTGGRVRICRDAFVGTGCAMIPDVIIGEGAVIGAGAVVINDIPARVTAVGIPARTIRMH